MSYFSWLGKFYVNLLGGGYLRDWLVPDVPDSPTIFSGPTPTVQRGTPINLLIGRERISPIYTWYGSRYSVKEETDGGKGFGGANGDPQETIWNEEGWHIIAIGPARRLWKIIENGETIFVGPIDPASHPSGTTIALGDGSSFVIYWGEADQPENTVLGAAGKLTEAGVSSRWPYLCYIHWYFKRLGTSPIWGRITYDLEVWPFDTKLVATPSWFAAAQVPTGPVQDISQVQDGGPGVAYIEFEDDDNSFKAGGFARIAGNTIGDGDYRVDSVVKNLVVGDQRRRIVLGQTVSGLTPDVGTIQALENVADTDGPNAAHIIYQLLFADPPHGRGLDRKRWSMASLEALGVRCQQENLRSVILADGTKEFADCIDDLLLDLGFMLYRDGRTGLLGFRAIRESTDIVELLGAHLTSAAPEITNVVDSIKPESRKEFTFKDRTRDYQPFPISIDDDGVASLDSVYGSDAVEMPTVRDLTTAWIVAKRRDQESYSTDMPVNIRAHFQAELIEPGQQVSIEDLDQALLVLSVGKRDSLSGEVEIDAIPNYYGVPASDAVVYTGGGETPEIEESGQDLEVIPFEVPQRLNGSGFIRVGIARIRNAATVSKTNVHFSTDDISYTLLGQDASIHTGGKLDVSVSATGLSLLDPGPTFIAEGPDIEGALDLSAAGSKGEWQRGRQVAILGDGEDREIWFVRWLESMGGGQYRMREVIRHRFFSSKQAWPSGTPVVIFDAGAVNQFADLTILADSDDFMKSQPIGPSPLALDDIAAFPIAIYGEGVRPLPVTALRGTDEAGVGANCWVFPNDPIIKWGYRTAPGPSSACPAELPAGSPKYSNPPCDGTVRLRITDPNNGDALLRQVELPADTTGQYQYADILADFGLNEANYANALGRFYLRSGNTSPTPADPNTLANSPSGAGNFTSFVPQKLLPSLTGTPVSSTLAVALANGGVRGLLFVTEPGVPALGTFPTGTWTAVLKVTNVTGTGGSPVAVGVGARILRLDQNNVVVQAGNIINSDSYNSGVDTLPKTFTLTIPTTTFTAGSDTDRLCLQVVISDLGAQTSTTQFSIELDAGASYLQKAGLAAPLLDFDVEASIVKGGYQSALETISVKARTTA